MNNRERFNCVMNFEKPDSFPMMEFMGYWPETRAAWEDVAGTRDLAEHFGLVKQQEVPIDFNPVPAFEEKILEETESHIIMIDKTGCTKRIENKPDCSSMPHYIDFPIKNRADFESMKERLDGSDHVRRYPENWTELVQAYKRRDYPLGAIIRGPFAFCRDFVNFQELMLMAYDHPGLVRDMMAFQVDFTIQLWDKLLNDVELDFIYIGEDMAYKSGPMFSPVMLNELLRPLYRKLTGFLKSNGVNIIILDSDGNVNSLLDLYVDSGFNCILPLERAAGMNPAAVREQYPELRMFGGIDKLKVSEGGDTMIKEMKNAVKVAEKGGFIPCFDHSVPPIISYENYKAYLELLGNMLGC